MSKKFSVIEAIKEVARVKNISLSEARDRVNSLSPLNFESYSGCSDGKAFRYVPEEKVGKVRRWLGLD